MQPGGQRQQMFGNSLLAALVHYLLEVAYVGPGAEGLAHAGYDEAPGRAFLHLAQGAGQFSSHLGREGIAGFGTVEGDGSHTLVLL